MMVRYSEETLEQGYVSRKRATVSLTISIVSASGGAARRTNWSSDCNLIDIESTDVNASLLLRMSYPAIGFLTQATGYPQEACASLTVPRFDADFYLCHDLKGPTCSIAWRLH
jgi:hypothetical protein